MLERDLFGMVRLGLDVLAVFCLCRYFGNFLLFVTASKSNLDTDVLCPRLWCYHSFIQGEWHRSLYSMWVNGKNQIQQNILQVKNKLHLFYDFYFSSSYFCWSQMDPWELTVSVFDGLLMSTVCSCRCSEEEFKEEACVWFRYCWSFVLGVCAAVHLSKEWRRKLVTVCVWVCVRACVHVCSHHSGWLGLWPTHPPSLILLVSLFWKHLLRHTPYASSCPLSAAPLPITHSNLHVHKHRDHGLV